MNEKYIKTPNNYLKDVTGVYGEGNLEMLVRDGNKLALQFKSRIEGRTRDADPTEAMRLRVHDPLWMLARQWQMGEFRGNNTGTAMSVRCIVRYEDCSSDPIEPVTEQINPRIDFLAKIESAVHFLDLMRSSGLNVKEHLPGLIQSFPIDWNALDDSLVLPDAVTSQQEHLLNRHLQNYARAYRGKIFDGEALYNHLVQGQSFLKGDSEEAETKFKAWFQKKYKPVSSDSQSWQEADLCYTVETNVAGKQFTGDRYQGGRLSWYTFDYNDNQSAGQSQTSSSKSEQVLCLPTPASFAAAPNKRLWQMEDRKVFMGNSVEEPSEANSVVMRFATMYSNDWMLFPLKTEIGQYITIERIDVIDSFGQRHTMSGNCRAGNKEQLGEYEEQWQVFVNSTVGDAKRTAINGLYYAQQLAATIEGKPVEEIKILRDEIANMVWGVENIVSDGCGGTLDANLYATQLETIVNERNKAGEPVREPDTIVFGQDSAPEVEKAASNQAPRAKFSYSLQSSVPFNWIPFIPQRLATEDTKNSPFFMGGREIILRRGKMPCYIFNGDKFDLHAVRPQSSIMRPVVTRDKNGNVLKEEPMVIHEEAVQATGIRLTKNYQRARWIGGKTYQWLGVHKRQSRTEASSGLVFDKLKEV